MEMSFRNNEQNDEPFEVLPGVQPPRLQHFETRFVGLRLFLLIFPTLSALPRGQSLSPLEMTNTNTFGTNRLFCC